MRFNWSFVRYAAIAIFLAFLVYFIGYKFLPMVFHGYTHSIFEDAANKQSRKCLKILATDSYNKDKLRKCLDEMNHFEELSKQELDKITKD